MALSLVGSASARAASCAIPAHQPGDLILVMGRSTVSVIAAAAPGGTVPTWTTVRPAAEANGLSMLVVAAVATATNHTTGTWTFCDDMIVLVIRAGAGKIAVIGASATGNGNNTQTVVYPALTLQDASGSSMGIRFGARGFSDLDIATVPSGWTWILSQPPGPSPLPVNVAHRRAALTTNPTADSVSVPGSNAAYRAATIEVRELDSLQTKAVGGVGSPAAFGTILALAHQKIQVAGVRPSGYVLTITARVLTNQAIVGGTASAQLGQVSATSRITTRVDVPGVGTAQTFGVPTIKAAISRTVTGIGSAQAFGAVTTKTVVRIAVAGVPSAEAFGITAPKTSIKIAVAGIPSAGAFGAVIIRTGFSIAVPGLGSAQDFGAINPIYVVHVPGLDSAQTFGIVELHAEIAIPVAGVASTQQFGSIYMRVRNVWIWPTTYVPSTGGSLTNQVICGDGHTVGGWDYLPASSRPETMELDPHQVSTLDLEPTLAK